ncbi:hypothetical protein ACE4Z5_24965, partial [Salmonella enterica]|uniref:hypothetical protein n=1 Tax=Salmonella enterica TaxID=28901 RepID=UPI003D290635
IDIGHHAAPGQYAGTVDRLARQAGADALLLVHAPYGMVPTGDVVQAVIPAAGTSAFWKAACVPDATAGERRALAAAGYAVFADPGRAVRGLALAL